MLEDLNNVLNTGELSNLFAPDETDKIVSDMIAVCKAANIPETRENCLAHFVSRVRDKLHIVLCMSPVGDSLRIRCRQFPSLINCTTIDWFHGWPEAALVSVAGQYSSRPFVILQFHTINASHIALGGMFSLYPRPLYQLYVPSPPIFSRHFISYVTTERFLGDLELPSEEVRTAVVRMCGFVHRSIESISVRFFAELRRYVLVPHFLSDMMSSRCVKIRGVYSSAGWFPPLCVSLATVCHRLQ